MLFSEKFGPGMVRGFSLVLLGFFEGCAGKSDVLRWFFDGNLW
jgi:hypothetical protein